MSLWLPILNTQYFYFYWIRHQQVPHTSDKEKTNEYRKYTEVWTPNRNEYP